MDDSSEAVKQYLEATATAGDPELLEKRIKEFADGKYIKPSILQSVAVQQRGIAAQVRLTQNTETTKSQIHVYLQTVKDLINAGGGDIKAANPAVAQQILNNAASGMSPQHLAQLVELVARNTTEQKQQQAHLEAIQKAGAASATGQPTKAAPDVFKEILKNPNLSPEDRAKNTDLLQRALANQKSEDVDQTVATSLGRYANGVDKLSDIIHQQLNTIATVHDPTTHAKTLQDLQTNIDRYQDAYTSLNSIKSTIKDPQMRELVDLHLTKADQEFGRMIGVLKNDPNAKDMHFASQSLYTRLSPKIIYPDPRQQQYYDYIHKINFYNLIQNHGMSSKDLQTIMNTPKNLQAMQNILQKNTLTEMRKLGLSQ